MYLQHHGIDGQKWGKRNGPPYPLDYNDRSAAEKRANPEKETKPLARKEAKQMNTADLQAAVNRKKLEQEYIKLSSQDITNGKDYVDKILRDAASSGVQTFTKTLVNKAAAAGANKVVDALLVPQLNKLFK